MWKSLAAKRSKVRQQSLQKLSWALATSTFESQEDGQVALFSRYF
jgi:hypothetical protein